MRKIRLSQLVAATAITFTALNAGASKIRDFCEIQGVQPNELRGIGLVVGLAGTGDKAGAAIKAQQRLLERLTIDVDATGDLKTDNAAVVLVTATFPPSAKQGTNIDVQVNSLYDAESLEGGTLMETLLYGIDKEVYAVAQGAVSVGGFNADAGGGTSVRQNHVTVGRIPQGATIEKEIPSTITDGERMMLLLKQPDFSAANNTQEAINSVFPEGTALALGAGAVSVTIPASERPQLVRFIARLQAIDVENDPPSVVVINERTGTIVVGGEVKIKPCQVAHGNITIQIATTPVFSQPNPLAGGVTAQGEVKEAEVKLEPAVLMPVQGTSAADVASTLNKLKVTPRDMISIFQAIKEAGALEGDLEIM
jgi:flagellar P-ring protein precursor FlgI